MLLSSAGYKYITNISSKPPMKRIKFAATVYKNFHHALNVLLHYLVKWKRSKMTQIVQKFHWNLMILQFRTCGYVIGSTSYNVVREFAQNVL